jgi:hypothetical protein
MPDKEGDRSIESGGASGKHATRARLITRQLYDKQRFCNLLHFFQADCLGKQDVVFQMDVFLGGLVELCQVAI